MTKRYPSYATKALQAAPMSGIMPGSRDFQALQFAAAEEGRRETVSESEGEQEGEEEEDDPSDISMSTDEDDSVLPRKKVTAAAGSVVRPGKSKQVAKKKQSKHHHHHHHHKDHHRTKKVKREDKAPPAKKKKTVTWKKAEDGSGSEDYSTASEEEEEDSSDTKDEEEEEATTEESKEKMHDTIVAKSVLPIFFLITENAPVRSCGRCAGCKPCGRCANCLKNVQNEKERQQKISEHPELSKAKRATVERLIKKKKKLKCSVARCERMPRGSAENTKEIKAAMARKEKERAGLAVTLVAPSGTTTDQTDTRRQFDAVSREIEALRQRMSAGRHGGLRKGHSYGLRLMKKIHKHLQSVARELVERGDLDDTGAERRANRDLAIDFLIRIAECNRKNLIGTASSEEWDRAIAKSRNFMTGGKLEDLIAATSASASASTAPQPKITIVS